MTCTCGYSLRPALTTTRGNLLMRCSNPRKRVGLLICGKYYTQRGEVVHGEVEYRGDGETHLLTVRQGRVVHAITG